MARDVPFFPEHEFGCRDRARGLTKPPYCNGSTGKGIKVELKEGLLTLREAIGRPIIISSGYRCPAYNKYVGGAPKSQHMLGTAADIMVRGYTSEQLIELVEELDLFTGRGLYPTRGFAHVDVRRGLFGLPTRWVQPPGKSQFAVASFNSYLGRK